ncbi:uncharacterized protein LOC135235088 [Anguilla rostrata]|uniref:uncharacterized protein LOC135235088 n=1 Tax=Anguilla rostrata TaxID=7938 RepID=UPI0030CCDCD2
MPAGPRTPPPPPAGLSSSSSSSASVSGNPCSAAAGMGCRLSGPLAGDGSGANGRHLAQTSRSEAQRILSSYEQPITWQIEGWSGRGHQSWPTSDCSTQTERSWDSCQGVGVTAGSASRLNAYMNRPCCEHVTQPHSHYRACEYLPSFPQGAEHFSTLGFQDPEPSSSTPKEQGCLFGCCGTNTDEPGSFFSQTEDEEPVPVGYLPLLHELDSGLGCTDGSFHQGELSGPETEEGVELGSPRDRSSPASSPSSQSLVSSELSDSGFYSVSAGDFHHFQRLLERKMRLYRACASGEMQERGGARLDLQSIPEASPPPRDMGPLQFRRAGSARLSRCPSGPLFPPQPGPSSCSTPSCLRRAALQQHNSSLGLLNISLRNLDRRRASHPSEHQRWRPAQDCPHVAQQQHHTLPREPCCKEFRLGHEALDRKEMAEWDWERQGGREHQCLIPSPLQEAHEAWSKPAGDPYNTLGPMGSPCSALGPMGSPCSELGPMGSPCSALAPMGSPCSELGPMGSPCSELGPMGSPCSALGPMGSPCSEGPGRVRMGRSQLLKARALRLADERSENTTDEEACEVQTGRYCSRAERRRHLLLAQEQRQRKRNGAKGGACQGGGACLGGGACQGGGASCSTVLELSHRKLSLLRNRKLLDDWTTVEELLTHGTRAGSQEILSFSPLLSVTTV